MALMPYLFLSPSTQLNYHPHTLTSSILPIALNCHWYPSLSGDSSQPRQLEKLMGQTSAGYQYHVGLLPFGLRNFNQDSTFWSPKLLIVCCSNLPCIPLHRLPTLSLTTLLPSQFFCSLIMQKFTCLRELVVLQTLKEMLISSKVGASCLHEFLLPSVGERSSSAAKRVSRGQMQSAVI